MSTGRAGILHLALVSLALSSVPHFSQGEGQDLPQALGNVGCLYSGLVCNEEEICFNDLAFGRCISTSSSYEDLTRFAWLSSRELGQLEVEMARVFGLGYSWPDLYTQCVFQTILHCLQYSQEYSETSCDHLRQAQQETQGEETQLQEQEGDEDLDRGGEWRGLEDQSEYGSLPSYYYSGPLPSALEEDDDIYKVLPTDNQNAESLFPDYPLSNFPLQDSSYDPQQLPSSDYFSRHSRSYPQQLPLSDYPDQILPELFKSNYPPLYFPSSQDVYPLQDDPSSYLLYIPDENNNVEDDLTVPDDTEYLVPNTRNVPEQYDDLIVPVDDHQTTNDDDNLSQLRTNFRQRRNDEDMQIQEPETLLDAIYHDGTTGYDDDTTGYHDGMTGRKTAPDYEFDYNDKEDEPLYYNLEDGPIPIETVFNRKERLDVKKPGPFFKNSQNNFFLDKLIGGNSQENDTSDFTDYSDDDLQDQNGLTGQTEYEMPLSPPGPRHKKDIQEKLVGVFDAEPVENKNYLFINIKDRFKTMSQGNRLVELIADHLGVPHQSFSDPMIESSRLVTEVLSNPRQLNATTMAGQLEGDKDLKVAIKENLGVDVSSFAAGNKDDEVTAAQVLQDGRGLVMLVFLLAAGLTSLLILAAVLLLVRRRSRNNTKLATEDPVISTNNKEEPVAEYKQLCRDWSRSSRPGSNGGKEPERPAASSPSRAKLPNKTRENSEGSRTSSTSSWNEEPGVSSMDISTGHMVLAYMEDHLKNKQRLEQEWVGLCAYEAEPSATSIAFKVENKKKNRYPDKLPYDHNRVILNPLTNGSSSDYINGSTVMDHDPRNPAYIVTQGPLAHTVADFWQMVWEQGSVVIIMLTNLLENGYQLAHRYWPEEGSEQYHIFEVHLVSEHVWCDDYLVRSVYLRNTQTGETRTVTQFHFLSWPDTGIPTSTKSILEFRRKVNKSYRGRSCPIIIHCSDGVGRSGTYILIDMVLNRMTKGSKEIDIAATLEHIRDQRSGMVQSRSQFEFCLTAVAEETHAILKALPQ